MKGQLRLLSGLKIDSPKGTKTRPTTSIVREALINLLGQKLLNCNWLDLYSGSGVVACEAIDRGAKNVLAIERDFRTAKVCNYNLSYITKFQKGQKHVEVIADDVIGTLDKGFSQYRQLLETKSSFDIAYIDPPYRSNVYTSVLEKLMKGNWLAKDSLVICEHTPKTEIEVNNEWEIKSRRKYGNSALLILSPP